MSCVRCTALILALGFAAGDAFAAVGAERFAAGLSYPVYLTAPPGDLDRVFVVENGGDIEILDVATGQARSAPFLSIAGASSLVGLAFHPDYASNGFFYVYYLASTGASHLVRYTRSAGDPDAADAASAHTVLILPTTFGHYGGWIDFGPDGLLYLLVGDNGSSGSHDAANNGQGTTGELLGDILRLDVDGDDFPGDPDRNYAIPPDNPFVGGTGEDEIWAYGLRNPWRGSFDRATGDFYVADVGEDTREEVNFELAGSPGGNNYGWRLREGTIATPTGGVGGPQPPDGVDPIYDYEHGTGDDEGNSVTGGYVYRGPIPHLAGRYFFGDFINQRIWSLGVDRQSGSVIEFLDWTDALVPDVGSIDSVVSFGEDAVGNLYVVDFDGEIFRIVWLPEFGSVRIRWVEVAAPGNPPDPAEGVGSVARTYLVGEFETTNAEYAEFLNAVAALDTNGLYNPSMESDASFGGITRSGSSGLYTYQVKPGFEEKPVTYVSFYDALRFANWLHNGQRFGAQDASTTEDGAYTITAAGITANSIVRNGNARFFLTSEDEWYKAAYYDTASGYLDYPAGSSVPTVCAPPGSTPNTANCAQATASLTDAGAYSASPSPHGTFDQGGNVWEWNEKAVGSSRAIRGGSWLDGATDLAASAGSLAMPTLESNALGFRVAGRIPVPPVPSLHTPAAAAIALFLFLSGLFGLRRPR